VRILSRARSLEIYNLDLDGKKLLRSLTRTIVAEHNKEYASSGCGYMTTGVPAGQETIIEDKLIIILKLKFLVTLIDLNIFIKLTGWLRNYILYYSTII
jgi:hypothetical protein